MLEAVKVALDPTPAQERRLLPHAGGARFAFNATLAHVKGAIDAGENIGRSPYAPRKWWNKNKGKLAVSEDGEPWWQENSKESYSYGLESLAKGACLTGQKAGGATVKAGRLVSRSSRLKPGQFPGSPIRPDRLASSKATRKH